MGHLFLQFQNVSFTYQTALEPLFEDVSVHATRGWTGIVGPNGSGKTTFLKLATGQLQPNAGRIDCPPLSRYCPQRTDSMPNDFGNFIRTTEKQAYVIRNNLGVQDDWYERWETLSHGERKRAQIAVTLWQEPDLLAIDEPTNHVDSDARKILVQALFAFQGVGLLVSHDRDLLDSLCQQCLFIDPPNVIVRPNGYSQGMQVAAEERKAREKDYALKKKAFKKIKCEAGRRRHMANQYDKKRSKKDIAAHDHDAKQKIDLVRISGKDIVGGKLLRQLDGRLAQAEQAMRDVHVKKEYDLGIWLPGSISKRHMLLNCPPGKLRLGDKKTLQYQELIIHSTDCIAVTGPNGAGKSTLLRYILTYLNVPKEHLTYVPQEIDIQRSQETLARVRKLSTEQLGQVMNIISRLGSRPHRLLESTTPSPGETRKLLLALGMMNLPHIIVLDEPTNHMDLPSIECLEAALVECPCALLLISHDQRFLSRLTTISWKISSGSDSGATYTLSVK
ncbi:ATPase, T2SS/T4P/T4SS family [Prosthecochloris sp.]|uniref:ATPase, T2SS/T4P/T4SS family n=1 Tax=Prosthecochloris sp. TaxID=290513 RepID=UPI00257DF194|nr:ATPase, T2SS/T4P/T4SS family [Prosthecochloris sp.]